MLRETVNAEVGFEPRPWPWNLPLYPDLAWLASESFFQADSVWIHPPHITELGPQSSLGKGGETAGPGREPSWKSWREKQ